MPNTQTEANAVHTIALARIEYLKKREKRLVTALRDIYRVMLRDHVAAPIRLYAEIETLLKEMDG